MLRVEKKRAADSFIVSAFLMTGLIVLVWLPGLRGLSFVLHSLLLLLLSTWMTMARTIEALSMTLQVNT